MCWLQTVNSILRCLPWRISFELEYTLFHIFEYCPCIYEISNMCILCEFLYLPGHRNKINLDLRDFKFQFSHHSNER